MHVITRRFDMNISGRPDQLLIQPTYQTGSTQLTETDEFLLATDQGAGPGATVKWQVRRQ
jgi:hypothetical protein